MKSMKPSGQPLNSRTAKMNLWKTDGNAAAKSQKANTAGNFDSFTGLRPFQAMQVIKTWSNAWATTHRFHEAARLPCLFGCADSADDLAHHASCELLRSIMIQFVADSPNACLALSTLGLSDPSVTNLKSQVCRMYVLRLSFC